MTGTSLSRLLACALVAGGAGAQTVLSERSEIVFTSRQMGVPVDGRFTRFEARVSFDPKQPEAGRIGLTIDTASARFGAPETDAETPKAAWFDSARFAHATFESTAIRPLGSGRYEVTGRLAIKGRSRDIVVPVTLVHGGQVATASGAFTVKRLDFGVGDGQWSDTSLVANDVQVTFKLALVGLSPP